jgi:hypothetical protein
MVGGLVFWRFLFSDRYKRNTWHVSRSDSIATRGITDVDK